MNFQNFILSSKWSSNTNPENLIKIGSPVSEILTKILIARFPPNANDSFYSHAPRDVTRCMIRKRADLLILITVQIRIAFH